MRALIIAVVILMVILGGWYYTYDSIQKDTGELIKSLKQINKQVNQEAWVEAEQKFLEVEKKWKEVRDIWSILLDHHEIDNIDLSVAKTGEYIQTKDKSLSLGELNVLKQLFTIVKESESFTLTNVF